MSEGHSETNNAYSKKKKSLWCKFLLLNFGFGSFDIKKHKTATNK